MGDNGRLVLLTFDLVGLKGLGRGAWQKDPETWGTLDKRPIKSCSKSNSSQAIYPWTENEKQTLHYI